MEKTVLELATELRLLQVAIDNERYPNLDGGALSYVSMFAMLATLIDLEKDVNYIKERIQSEIEEKTVLLADIRAGVR